MAVTDAARVDGQSAWLFRAAFRPVWLVIGVTTLAHLVGGTVPVDVRYGVLLVTLAVFGLPHGAVDHLSVPRALDAPPSKRTLGAVGGLYLLLGAAYAAVWFLAPAVAFAGFILLTWFHWGQGDLYPLRAVSREYPRDRVATALTLVVRGGLPMLVPLVFFPGRYREVAVTLVSLFAPGRGTALSVAFQPTVRLAVGVGFGALTLATLAWGYRTSHAGRDARRTWRIDATETLLLWAFFAVVPPVLAIGLYFPLWHSLRHILRVVDLDATADRSGRSVLAHLRRFAVEATPATGGAVVLLGALALAVPHTPATVADIAAVYLVLLAVLTLPHVVVVTWLDREQGVWPAVAVSRTENG